MPIPIEDTESPVKVFGTSHLGSVVNDTQRVLPRRRDDFYVGATQAMQPLQPAKIQWLRFASLTHNQDNIVRLTLRLA